MVKTRTWTSKRVYSADEASKFSGTFPAFWRSVVLLWNAAGGCRIQAHCSEFHDAVKHANAMIEKAQVDAALRVRANEEK